MPELPEVETTRRGLAQRLPGSRVASVIVRDPRLRWPVDGEIGRVLPGQTIRAVDRRGKYLLFHATGGAIILHLGMSGSLRIVPAATPPEKHDHVDFVLAGGPKDSQEDNDCLRFRDPRRFGAILWTGADPLTHPRLADLGPEPLGDAFSGEGLFRAIGHRQAAIKCLLLDGKVVAGLGNIYVSETLFRAGILPQRPARAIPRHQYHALAAAIRQTLMDAIQSGGTTLRDFFSSDGQPGYFRQRLRVYGRVGQPCPQCGRPVEQQRVCQRSSFFCPRCQR